MAAGGDWQWHGGPEAVAAASVYQNYTNYTLTSLNGTYCPPADQWRQCGDPIPLAPTESVLMQELGPLLKQANSFTVATPPKKEAPKVRGLFEVFIVDGATAEVVAQHILVADDDGKARLKAATRQPLPKDVDEYDILVRRIGDVRAKKSVQEVKFAL